MALLCIHMSTEVGVPVAEKWPNSFPVNSEEPCLAPIRYSPTASVPLLPNPERAGDPEKAAWTAKTNRVVHHSQNMSSWLMPMLLQGDICWPAPTASSCGPTALGQVLTMRRKGSPQSWPLTALHLHGGASGSAGEDEILYSLHCVEHSVGLLYSPLVPGFYSFYLFMFLIAFLLCWFDMHC